MPAVPRRLALPLCAAAVVLTACAATHPVAMRLQIRTVSDWPQLGELTERVSQIAGMPVGNDPAVIAPQWVALTLQCPDRSSCKRAAMRLAARQDLVAELRPDDMRRLPRTPTPETSQ